MYINTFLCGAAPPNLVAHRPAKYSLRTALESEAASREPLLDDAW